VLQQRLSVDAVSRNVVYCDVCFGQNVLEGLLLYCFPLLGVALRTEILLFGRRRHLDLKVLEVVRHDARLQVPLRKPIPVQIAVPTPPVRQLQALVAASSANGEKQEYVENKKAKVNSENVQRCLN